MKRNLWIFLGVLFAAQAGAQTATHKLTCGQSIISTHKYGPVALRIDGGNSDTPGGFVGQKIKVTSANAYLARQNAPEEESTVTVMSADQIDGDGNIAVNVKLSSESTANRKSVWFVCSMVKNVGRL